MLLVAPGSWLQLSKVGVEGPGGNIWDPRSAHTQTRDLNQVMKNRSGHKIIQSSSLIRFHVAVICEWGLKPCPCVCVMWEHRGRSLSSLIVHLTRLHARYTRVWERAIKPKHTHHSLLLSFQISEITSTISIFIHFSSQPGIYFWLL